MDEPNAYQQFFLIRIYDSQPTVVFFLVGGKGGQETSSKAEEILSYRFEYLQSVYLITPPGIQRSRRNRIQAFVILVLVG